MKRTPILAGVGIAVLVALIVGGWLAFQNSRSSTSNNTSTQSMSQPADPSEKMADHYQPQEDPTKRPGAYVDYSDTVIADSSGTKLLFFYAPWCAQCRALDENLKATTLPYDVTVIKVDYDSHQDLRKKYGVTLQTTVVKVDDQGNKIASYVAYDSPTYASIKENLL